MEGWRETTKTLYSVRIGFHIRQCTEGGGGEIAFLFLLSVERTTQLRCATVEPPSLSTTVPYYKTNLLRAARMDSSRCPRPFGEAWNGVGSAYGAARGRSVPSNSFERDEEENVGGTGGRERERERERKRERMSGGKGRRFECAKVAVVAFLICRFFFAFFFCVFVFCFFSRWVGGWVGGKEARALHAEDCCLGMIEYRSKARFLESLRSTTTGAYEIVYEYLSRTSERSHA